MTPRTHVKLFVLLMLHALPVIAQSDELLKELKNARHDTTRLRLLNKISNATANSDVEAAIKFGRQAEQLADKLKDTKAKAEAMGNIAYAVYYSGKSDSAMHLYNRLIVYARKNGDSSNVALCFNRLGFIYREKGQPDQALLHYKQSLKSNVNEAQKAEAATSYLNIGVIYDDLGNPKEALSNELYALKLYQEIQDEVRIANAYARIGNVYTDMDNDSAAIRYYEQSMALFGKNNHKRGVAICLNNLAMIYSEKGDKNKAIELYRQALRLRTEVGDKNGVALIANNMGIEFTSLNQFDSAYFYIQKSMGITQSIGYRDMTRSNYEALAMLFAKQKKYDEAYHCYVRYHELNDSLFNEKNSKLVAELNAQFESEKRQKENEFLSKQNQLNETQLRQQKKQNIFLIVGVALLTTLVIIIWRGAIRSRNANRELKIQKAETDRQKKIVEEQHRDMLDSISYARRIQTAVLPAAEEMQKLFPLSFVLYKPKDIVSGDFWWITERDGKKIIALADCTGHGVPGAFMSLIGTTLLNEIINVKHITSPGAILDMLTAGVIHSLRQTSEQESTRDGMDISLLVFDPKSNTVAFAAANHSMYFVRNNILHEIKGNRQPVGFFEYGHQPFTVHELDLNHVEEIFLMSDGFADQFGGPQGKKFKYRQLCTLFQEHAQQSVQDQHHILEKAFNEWKGNQEQVDDVLVIGIKTM
ncbi:MAG: hypothetical protein Fur0041_00090 [Bacteroidia bacterium]